MFGGAVACFRAGDAGGSAGIGYGGLLGFFNVRIVVFRPLSRAVSSDRAGCAGAGPSGAGTGNADFFSYLCTKPCVAAVIIHIVQTADFCLYSLPAAILDVRGGKNVNFPRNAFQMRRNLPGFLRSADFCDFLSRRACPALRETTPAMRDSGGPCQQLLNTKNDSL